MRVGVMGAGAIGCYLGGRLVAQGEEVVMVGRPSLASEIAEHGMRLSDYRSRDSALAPGRIAIATDVEALRSCDVVLVTVKGGDTVETGRLLDGVLDRGAVVVSFQNGVSNPALLREALGDRTVLAGMVPFNVLRSEGGRFHQGTSGHLAVERSSRGAGIVRALAEAGLEIDEHDDMRRVLWGKLLINLNNSVNALAGVPIRTMIETASYRRVMAACMGEGLDVVAAAGIRPKVEIPIPPRFVPYALRLPDFVFKFIAPRMVHVDREARSSMWDDLERGRRTEIDSLNGEIVRLAEQLGREAKVNAAIVRLVKAAEGARSPQIRGDELCDKLGLS